MDKSLQDLAWSVLPKEFKEKVEKIYSALLAGIKMYQGDNPEQVGTTDPILWERALGIKSILCRIFGKHNLTSNAEGEEMLMCEKSKVMKLYNKFQKDGTFTCLYAAGVLDTLFGTKCLLDEKPKPAEPTFKVGDKVRTMKVMSKDYVGKVGAIDCQDDGGYIVTYDDGSHAWSAESDLEPYTEPEEKDHIEENPEIVKDFDGFCNDSFRNERRLNIAAMAMQGIITRVDETPEVVAEVAYRYADALISGNDNL